MKAQYKISQDDYVKSGYLYSELTKIQSIFCALIVAALVAAIYLVPAAIKGPIIGGLVVGLIFVIILKYLVNPFYMRRHYQQYKAIQESFEIELLDDGIFIQSPSGGGKVTWQSMHKWRHNNTYILMYPMPRLYYIVPKSLRDSGFNIDLLMQQLAQHVGKAS